MKNFFKKNWIHFACVAFMIIVCAIYFKPQFEEYGLKQHDIEQWKGMAHETDAHREMTGEEALWTNSMFGGMPAVQISVMYTGNLVKVLSNGYSMLFNGPFGVVLMHLLGFYLLALFLRIHPLVGMVGAIAMGFASYEIIIIQAGHHTKAMASSFLAPTLGAFIYTYRENKKIAGLALSGFFMALELAANHVQVTYYFLFVLLFVGLYFLIDAIVKKQVKSFLITSAGIIGVYILAGIINIGNIALTNDYAKYTIRGGNDITIQPDGTPLEAQSSGLERDYITQWSYGIGETFTLISPNVKGGGSFVLGDSQFEDILENANLNSQQKAELKNYPAYWGEQPFTSGPVYIGVISVFLAFLGLFFIQSGIKWALFAVTLLAVMLSWGKNFMGLTDFFIDYIPGYNKFRTVTIILIVVELCVPLMGIIFLDRLIRNKAFIKERIKTLMIASAGFIVFMIAVSVIGLGDGYTSSSDQRQLDGVRENYLNQIMSMDPEVLQSQYGIDVNNAQQVSAFIDQQVEPIYENFENLKVVREDIYHASWTRSVLFTIFALGFILVYLYTSINGALLGVGMIILVMLDVIPVAYDYLGAQEQGNGLKYWDDKGLVVYPVRSNEADAQILEMELAEHPHLQSAVQKGEKRGERKAEELGYTGAARRNVMDAYTFSALNFATNYRVFDLSGGFQSSRAAYFHKSLGGYHGAKLRNINNLMDFHLSKMNNKVYDMMNVRYFIQNGEQGQVARKNPTAMGNAWLVKRVEVYETPNDEIRALGTRFDVKNIGQGTLLVNGEKRADASVFGSEKLQYLISGVDTINVPLSNGMTEGIEAIFVMDKNGKTDLVMPQVFESDTAKNSFLKLVNITATNEFKPREEAVMLKSEAQKLKKKEYSGEGSVRMTSYAPNKIVYDANLEGDQLVVFSEVYYPDGWKAYVDGKETDILKVNYLLRGVEMTGGKHKVELVFDLPTFHTANTINFIGSIILFLLLGFALYLEVKKKRSASTNS